MIKVDLKNADILEFLHGYSSWFMMRDLLFFRDMCEHRDPEEVDRIVSDEELANVMVDANHVGFPLDAKAISVDGFKNPEIRSMAEKFKREFKYKIGAKHTAFNCFYPEDGFISWHTNENAPGKNLILSYSSDGLSFFKFLDPTTNEIVTIQDEIGWNAKMGNFGPSKEDRVWHCARNYGPRITVSYIIDDWSMWDDLKEELETE